MFDCDKQGRPKSYQSSTLAVVALNIAARHMGYYSYLEVPNDKVETLKALATTIRDTL